jgi:hypothetical protein
MCSNKKLTYNEQIEELFIKFSFSIDNHILTHLFIIYNYNIFTNTPLKNIILK